MSDDFADDTGIDSPDTGTELAPTGPNLPDGAPGTDAGDGWQEPTRPDGVLDFAGNVAHTDYAFAAMAYWGADKASALRSEWGNDAGANLAFADAFAVANPDIMDIINNAGMSDDPALVKIAAVLGRQAAEISGDPTTIINKAQPMNALDFDERTETMMNEATAARGRGDLAKAARIQKQIDAMFTRQFGDEPAVGSEGRTA